MKYLLKSDKTYDILPTLKTEEESFAYNVNLFKGPSRLLS